MRGEKKLETGGGGGEEVGAKRGEQSKAKKAQTQIRETTECVLDNSDPNMNDAAERLQILKHGCLQHCSTQRHRRFTRFNLPFCSEMMALNSGQKESFQNIMMSQ